MRLVVILLLLVVLPTGILSLLAGRSIQSRELILHRRLEQDAIQAIDDVCDQFYDLLLSDSHDVRNAFQNSVLAGMSIEHVGRVVGEAQGKSTFVKRAYLFMNPWGFVYPKVPDPIEGQPVPDDFYLGQDLKELFSRGGHALQAKVSLYREGRVYCFTAVPEFAGVHSGFEVDVGAAMERLDLIMSERASAGITLRIAAVAGPTTAGVDVSGDVEVSDSFDPRPGRPVRSWAEGGGEEGALASGALPSPFAHVRIGAFLVNEDDIQKAEELEARLIGWGILLLAIVITASSAILINRTVRQAAVARERSEFVIGMSHDLRTPIASMRVLADSLAAGRVADPEKQKRFLQTIASECERLGDMIERVLFFFRQERQTVTYSMVPFDMGDLVRRAVGAFQDRLPGRGKVHVAIPDSCFPVVGDMEALTKVLNNLLDNALKYGTPSGGSVEHIGVSLALETFKGATWVVLTVSDEGPGISEREQKRVFERFYRGRVAGKDHVGGIGLGLSLCSDIVRAHRGRITVESTVGSGASFVVRLRCRSEMARS
jgi:signal transduction histidine kinase